MTLQELTEAARGRLEQLETENDTMRAAIADQHALMALNDTEIVDLRRILKIETVHPEPVIIPRPAETKRKSGAMDLYALPLLAQGPRTNLELAKLLNVSQGTASGWTSNRRRRGWLIYDNGKYRLADPSVVNMRLK